MPVYDFSGSLIRCGTNTDNFHDLWVDTNVMRFVTRPLRAEIAMCTAIALQLGLCLKKPHNPLTDLANQGLAAHPLGAARVREMISIDGIRQLINDSIDH